MTSEETSHDDERKGLREKFQADGLRAKKSFGQCFLADRNIAGIIAKEATTPIGGTVVEIGAGTGALTVPLLERASRVIAIERDRDLVPLLAEALGRAIEEGRLQILEADALKQDFAACFLDTPKPHVLAGNLPYQITGPLLQKAMEVSNLVDRVVFMVQKEVAERIVAPVGTKDYGVLSVFVRSAFEIIRKVQVPASCFRPRPRVDSTVLVLEPLGERGFVRDEQFVELVHSAFGQRRKTLRNNWKRLSLSNLDELAALADISLDVRGETLSSEDFARAAKVFREHRRA